MIMPARSRHGVLKKFDEAVEGKVKPGFEMLVDNFSLGIIGAWPRDHRQARHRPRRDAAGRVGGRRCGLPGSNNLLPLVSIIVEPAKVLFLNNAINHGVFTPLGSSRGAGATASRILFMIESNPGPGLGSWSRSCSFGPRCCAARIPGVAIIHFFGGIHEVYFPFVLMKPKLILATILGGMAGVLTGTSEQRPHRSALARLDLRLHRVHAQGYGTSW